MNLCWTTAADWLLHCALGGGLLLLLTCLLMRRTPEPVKRQRLGEWGLAAALVLAVLSLSPPWLIVGLATAPAPEPLAPEPAPAPPDDVVAWEHHGIEPHEWPEQLFEPLGPPEPAAVEPLPMPELALAEAEGEPWWQEVLAVVLPWLVVAWAVSALLLACRWLLGHLALVRLLRAARPAPQEVERLFEEMTAGPSRPRLLVSARLRVPISCGLLRPTVLLPATMCDPPDLQKLRWVFAHELTHLERRDAWSAVLFAVGQAVYFFVPWFRWLKRQVRLCQEYIADAAASRDAAGGPADYAEFLLSLSGAPAAPAAASAVSGNCSDLYRRVSMLLQEPQPVQRRCSRRWSLAAAGGLLALAVLAAGIGLRAEANPPEIVVAQEEAQPGNPQARKVRVIVVPGGQDVKPDVLFLKKADGPAAGERVIIIKKTLPGQEKEDIVKKKVIAVPLGERVIVRGQDGDLEALRKALEMLEQGPARPELEAVRQEIRKALEKAKAAQGARVQVVPLEAVRQPLPPALDGLRKALKELDKHAGRPGVDEARKALQEAIKSLEGAKLPGGFAVPALPKVIAEKFDLEVVPGMGGVAGWRFGGPPLDPKIFQKLREELKKQPNAEELLKALDAWEKGQRGGFGGAGGGFGGGGGGFRGGFEGGFGGGGGKGQFWAPMGARSGGTARLGVQVEKPSDILADQLNLPKGSGLVVKSVKADSPAARAGIKANDVLLQVAGKSVPSEAADFAKLLDQIKGDTAVDAVVLRKGKRESVKGIQLGEAGRVRVEGFAPKGFGPGGMGEQGALTTVFRSADNFTVHHQEGSLMMNVSGTYADGKAKLGRIHIQSGATSNTYDRVASVPAQYRGKVNQLLEMASRGAGPR